MRICSRCVCLLSPFISCVNYLSPELWMVCLVLCEQKRERNFVSICITDIRAGGRPRLLLGRPAWLIQHCGLKGRQSAARRRGKRNCFVHQWATVECDTRSDGVVRPIILPSHGNDRGSNPRRSILRTQRAHLRNLKQQATAKERVRF